MQFCVVQVWEKSFKIFVLAQLFGNSWFKLIEVPNILLTAMQYAATGFKNLD